MGGFIKGGVPVFDISKVTGKREHHPNTKHRRKLKEKGEN
jgi:hypothetical protein